MKKIKKTSCNNQGIKRFLSPQPSNIPCKKQCKRIDIANECTTQKGKDNCRFSHNSKKQDDEIEKTKSNLQVSAGKLQKLSAKHNTTTKFDWNCFVRDPGEMQESRYPVTLNTFKTMTHSFVIVNCILEDIKTATSIDFVNDELMKERVLKNFYIQFYENPQIRDIYKLETKPCPTFVKKKIMQIPTLENIEVKVSTSNAPKEATTNIAHVEVVSKPKELSVPAEPTIQTAEPVSKPVELARVEAQSSKAQANEITPQHVAAKSRDHANILYISKNISYINDDFLRRHIRRNIQQVEKQEIILARINAELLQRKNIVQSSEEKPIDTQVHELSTEVLIDISKTTEVSAVIITKEQRIAQVKNLFLKEYKKSNTLAYALRFHNGLKRRIISAILEMSIDEFKKYTKIHNAPEMYNDTKLLHDCYNYAIKAPKIWPVKLYMQLCDLFEYLKTKSVALSVDNLVDISPMLLHWTELAVITNFDEIMQWDFYRCKGEKFAQFTQLDIYRETFYEKCWLHNAWLRKVPKLNSEVQKQLTTVMEVIESDIINEEVSKNNYLQNESNETASANVAQTAVKLEVVHEAANNLINTTTTEHSEATNVEPAHLMDVDCVERIEEVSTLSVHTNAAIAEHAQVASAGHLAASNETLLMQNVAETTAIVQTPIVNEKQNTLTEATVNLQTTTTTTIAVVTTTTNSNETIVSNSREIDAQQRIQAAKQLYFYDVEKSCTLPYLLRLHNGLKRRILHAILHMSFTEFKQYTHIYDAAEIYKNNALLKHCYDFVVKKPQVWPVNLYMRLLDLYEFLKSKGITLTAADLTHVSPKLLHWHDLSATTNYDYIVYWDYYRCSGKKMHSNENLLNSYRQSFYEKCWFYDNWIWHTPKISGNVLSEHVVVEDDKQNANFESSVVTHALAERAEESETIVEVVTMEEESDTPAELPFVEANVVEHLVPSTNNARSVSTANAEIQTSQHLLATYSKSSNILRESAVTAENPNPIILPSKAIKQEKLSPLDKLQFNLINDDEHYECVPVPDDIVDLESSILTNESQEDLLLPLSNSENLATHDANLLLSFESPKDQVAQQSVQLTENMETERIIEQQPNVDLNDESTQLLSECVVEMEIEIHTTEDQQNTTQQQQIVQDTESEATFAVQPQVEMQTKSPSVVQEETCTTQEQQKQVHIGEQQVLSNEEANGTVYISREVKQELLQQVQQQPVDNCTEQQKQVQPAAQKSKNSHIEVATALTRIIEAHKLAKQKKQQHTARNSATAIAPTQTKQQQQTVHEEPTVKAKQQQEKQQPKSTIENQRKQQQQQQQQQQPVVIIPLPATLQQQHKKQQPKSTIENQRTRQQQQQQQPVVIIPLPATPQQQHKKQQPKSTIENQRTRQQQQQQQQSPAVIIPLPATPQQQHIKQKQKILIEKRITQNQQVPLEKQTAEQQQGKENPTTTTKTTELQSTAKKQQLLVRQPKAQTSNDQRSTAQQQQQQPPATVVIPTSMLQQQKQQQSQVVQPKPQTSFDQRSTQQQQQQQKQQQKPPATVVILPQTLQQQKEIAVEKQAARKQRLAVDQKTTQIQQQQQPITKSQKTQGKSQITNKTKVTNTKKPLEAQQLATAQQRSSQPGQLQSTQPRAQQQLQAQQRHIVPHIETQMVVGFDPTNELRQDQQFVPQIVAKAAVTQTQTESVQQLTQAALPIHLVQQQSVTENKNENKLHEAPQQLIAPIKENQAAQQQTILESSNASKQTGIPFISQPLPTQSTAQQQQQQQQLNQPQFILQRTSTQIQQQLVIRPAGAHSQDTPIDLPPLIKLANKQTTTTTNETKVIKTVKPRIRRFAKQSDYVPQLTHVFQPLAVALNTKKAPTPPPINNNLPQTTANIATTSNLQSAIPAIEEEVIAAGNITVSPSNSNAMILTLPVSMNAASTSASNSSYVYSLSGHSTFFNSSELLKALENYQVQHSQQQQVQSEQLSEQQQQQQSLMQSEQLSQQQQQQSTELVYVQPQMAQLQQQQQYEPMQQQQQYEPMQQQQQYESMQQQQQFEYYNPLQVMQQHHHQQQQQQQQHYQAVIEMPQTLSVLESVEEQEQQQQQQQPYQLLLQQQQQQQHQQPIVFQFVDVNQAPHTVVEQYLQLSEAQTQTAYIAQPAVQAASTNQVQQQAIHDTKQLVKQQTYNNEMLQGVCRMRARPPPKPFFYQRLEKLDYFRVLTAHNIAEYQLQCNSLGKPYLQAKLRTTHQRTVVSGDMLSALLPRYAPDLVKNLHLLLQYLGEFHFNTWEQRQQRKLISKCAHRTLHTLCAHILLLFFEYSTPFQLKCLDLAAEMRSFKRRDSLNVATASASSLGSVDMREDLSLAIDPSILTEMTALKRNL